MVVKYVLDQGERGVEVFGRVHGVVVLVYVAAALMTSRRQRWIPRTLLASLLASVPPFGSIVFERWATRTGQLGAVAAARRPAPVV